MLKVRKARQHYSKPAKLDRLSVIWTVVEEEIISKRTFQKERKKYDRNKSKPKIDNIKLTSCHLRS